VPFLRRKRALDLRVRPADDRKCIGSNWLRRRSNRYIIVGDKYRTVCDVYPRNAKTIEEAFSPIGKRVVAGIALVYPEFNLLWLDEFPVDRAEEMSVEDFDQRFASLPRWEATRYAVMYGINNRGDDNRVTSYAALLCDCQTGERLFDKEHKPVEGREHEIEQLRRGIELLANSFPQEGLPSHPIPSR
jgi:hypothetical protein